MPALRTKVAIVLCGGTDTPMAQPMTGTPEARAFVENRMR